MMARKNSLSITENKLKKTKSEWQIFEWKCLVDVRRQKKTVRQESTYTLYNSGN